MNAMALSYITTPPRNDTYDGNNIIIVRNQNDLKKLQTSDPQVVQLAPMIPTTMPSTPVNNTNEVDISIATQRLMMMPHDFSSVAFNLDKCMDQLRLNEFETSTVPTPRRVSECGVEDKDVKDIARDDEDEDEVADITSGANNCNRGSFMLERHPFSAPSSQPLLITDIQFPLRLHTAAPSPSKRKFTLSPRSSSLLYKKMRSE